MDFVVIALLTVLIGFLLACVLYQRSNEKMTRETTIPGAPRSHPTEGNAQEFAKAGGRGPFVRTLHQKYGPIVSFYEGSKLAVSIASPVIVKEIRFLNLVPAGEMEPFRELVGDGCFVYLPIEMIIERRKQFEPLLMSKTTKTFFTYFQKVAEEFTDKWKKLTPDDHVSITDCMSKATLKAILKTSYGDHFNDEEEVAAYRKRDQQANEIIQKYPYTEEQKAMLRKIGIEQRAVARKILEDRRKKTNSTDKDNQLLIDLFLDSDETDEMRIGDSLGFLIAGTSTTSMLLSNIFYIISTHPDVQQTLYEEIRDVLGGNHVDNDTFPKLTYMRQVTDETFRNLPIGDMFGRVATEDIELAGHHIPKGSNIYYNFAEMAKNPEFFPNPDKFNPENFSKQNTRKRNPYAFKPFGFAGKRQCPGISFTYIQVAVFLSEWCRHFEFNLVPDSVKFSHGLLHYLEEALVKVRPRKL